MNKSSWLGVRASVVTLAMSLLAVALPGCRSEARPEATARPEYRTTEQPPVVRQAVFAVRGMTCRGCEAGVVYVLSRVPGVVSAKADYQRGRAWAEYDPSRAELGELVQAIESLGYSAQLLERSE